MNTFLQKRRFGFTLAELLIALAILGVIATFTIPKILASQSNAQASAIAKEFVSSLAGVYKNLVDSGLSFDQIDEQVIFDNLNSVNPHYTGITLKHPDGNFYSCATLDCMLFHNGSITWRGGHVCFKANLGNNQALLFMLDPDASGPLIAEGFALHPNGRITTYENINTNTNFSFGTADTCNVTQVHNPTLYYSQSWFSWN